jgi:hypothetical protein
MFCMVITSVVGLFEFVKNQQFHFFEYFRIRGLSVLVL